MDKSAMKPIAVLFFITFGFFFLGQAFWTHGLYMDDPLFGSRELDELWSTHAFTVSSVFGLIASAKLYLASR